MASNILLDLDGTLTNPREGITACIRYALRTLDWPVPSDTELDQCIGPPLQGSFLRILGDAELADQALQLYRERFSVTGLYENTVYSGIEQALVRLRQRGARLTLVTSKPRVYAERIVGHFGLDEHLSVVYGSELDGTRTDKRELLAFVLQQAGLNADDCLMVGDRRFDAEGARSNAIEPVGVLWGFGSREELQAAGVSRLLERPEQLGGLMDG